MAIAGPNGKRYKDKVEEESNNISVLVRIPRVNESGIEALKGILKLVIIAEKLL